MQIETFALTAFLSTPTTSHLWHEGVSIINKILEKGNVIKYEFEEPYEESKETIVTPKGEAVVNFDPLLR